MSEDIRSVRSFLGSIRFDNFNPALVDLACSNLDSLAEQAEVLENTPLAVNYSMFFTSADVEERRVLIQ
jgi:hypothetical protein